MSRSRRVAFVLPACMAAALALAALTLAAGGCSSSSNTSSSNPEGGLTGDAAVPPVTSPEAGTDAATLPDGAPAAELPACLGSAIPVVITTGPHASLKVGAAPSPYAGSFLIDYATTGSTIDLSVFAAPGPTATMCNPALLGQLCTFADLDLFGPSGQVTLRTSTATILGTDFLSLGIFTLDYANTRMLHVPSKGAACSDAALGAAGLAPLSTTGFFTNDLTQLKQQHDIDSAAPANLQVANVPMVPMRLAGKAAIAQLDTGFDDKVVPHSINVNVALFDALSAALPGALVRDAAKDLSLSTCAGVAEPVEAYELAAGSTFELVDETGAAARTFTTATVFVKRTPAAALKCGGIGTWSAPAAQIGTSFFTDMGALVFDPYASRVWVRR